MSAVPSMLRRRQLIDALRIGAVPRRGLEHIATGLGRYEAAIVGELDMVATGEGRFKGVRGEYGTGKTFFARWVEHTALERGFASSLVQISESEAPLHRFEMIYRALIASLATKEQHEGAFRGLLEKWVFTLENEVAEAGRVDPNDAEALGRAVSVLLDQRLEAVSAVQPLFASVLRAWNAARTRGDHNESELLLAWAMGQPNVGASIKRAAGVQGEMDGTVAMGFLRGLLELLRQTGRHGLVLVLDEVETIQRIRMDHRDRALGELRKLIDDLVAGRYPGLYVVLTGTPLFFDGPSGVRRLPPLAQRLEVAFGPNPAKDSAKQPQIRLMPFDFDRLLEVGRKVRALYPSADGERIVHRASDAVLSTLANNVASALSGKLGVAPRIYLKRLVQLLDQIDEHPDFDPLADADLTIRDTELTVEELSAAGRGSPLDEIPLDLSSTDRTGEE